MDRTGVRALHNPMRDQILFLLAAGLSFAGWGRSAAAETLTLAHGGKPTATIVIPRSSPKIIAGAARDLQHYVEILSGVTLPIRMDGKAVEGTGLYIGRCAPTKESDFPKKGLNPETYAISMRDGSVYFTGRWPTPTTFAVSSFIEQNLGVRWFAPGDLWEYVPQGTKGELTLEVTGRVKVPDVSPRVWSGHDWVQSWKDWNLRNKTVQSEVVPRREFQNNIYKVFPPSKYGKTHPEYYPLINGKRWIPANDQERKWWPCISNPDVVKLTVEYADHFFDTHPNVDSFSLGMDDVVQMCSCDKCRAMDAAADDFAHKRFSDRFYKFVNEVARDVHNTHPDRYIGTLIYDDARTLPRTVDKLEDNVFGYLTQCCFQWWQPGLKEADEALSREWARRCKHLSRYDYFGMGTMTPRVAPHAMAEEIKFDGSLGFEGMYTEMYTFLPNTAPMVWALAKMQWDRSLDVDALLNEFYKDMYGSAAPTMKQYFDLLEKSWNTPRPGRPEKWVSWNIVSQSEAMSLADLDQATSLLKQALGEAHDPKVRQRIQINHAGLQYGSYPIRMNYLAQQLVAAKVTDEASAGRVLAAGKQMASLMKEAPAFWAAAAQRDDLLGQTVYGLGPKRYKLLQTARVAWFELSGVDAIANALQWDQQHDPAKSSASLAALEPLSERFHATLSALQWVKAHHPKNLAQNGDFEAAPDAAPRSASESDWAHDGLPAGWSYWSRSDAGRRGVAAGQGVDGSRAAFTSGADGGTFIQSIPAKPGERYLVQLQVRADVEPAWVFLYGRFHTPANKWYPDHTKESVVKAKVQPGQWQTLTILVDVPQGAASMQTMIEASKGTSIHIDNAAAYRVGD
jgi:hypothetical protein